MEDDAGMATIDLLSFGMSRRYEELLDRAVEIVRRAQSVSRHSLAELS
jgi:hypothetical protein